MSRVFADTFYFIGLLSPRDESHVRCRTFSEQTSAEVVTTDWVFTELGDGLAKSTKRQVLHKFREHFASIKGNVVIPTSKESFEEGLALYDSRPDKGWSLTDCISFIVMQEQGLTAALTADRHFEQAGFTCLLLG